MLCVLSLINQKLTFSSANPTAGHIPNMNVPHGVGRCAILPSTADSCCPDPAPFPAASSSITPRTFTPEPAAFPFGVFPGRPSPVYFLGLLTPQADLRVCQPQYRQLAGSVLKPLPLSASAPTGSAADCRQPASGLSRLPCAVSTGSILLSPIRWCI